MTTRRDLLRAAGAAGIAAALGGKSALAAAFGGESALAANASDVTAGFARDPLRGVGIQLYTLRNQMREDQLRTLERIARIGYTEIEWWGEYGRTPAQLRSLLDANGLSAPAWHLDPRLLEPAQLGATLDTAATMGHKHLIVAWLPPAQRTQDGFKRIADLLNAASERAASIGVRTAYHNHDFEFLGDDESTLWDVLVGHTDSRLVDLELDCYWAFKAGFDPIALLRNLKDRITHLHLKDSTAAPAFTQCDLGEGVIDWRTLLTTATAGRVQHVFVEHDAPADAWVTAEVGRRYMRSLGY